jgi:hypothetical protein
VFEFGSKFVLRSLFMVLFCACSAHTPTSNSFACQLLSVLCSPQHSCGCGCPPLYPSLLPHQRPFKTAGQLFSRVCSILCRFVPLMLRRAFAAKVWLPLLTRHFASSVTAHPTPNERAFKFLLPRRIAVNGCSVDLRSRDLFQPQLLDDVVAKVCRR